MLYKYGMRLRGFAPGCQPMDHLTRMDTRGCGRYHCTLWYRKRLTDREVADYELEYLGEVPEE